MNNRRIVFNKQLLAYCGLYCAQCSFKTAYEENDFKHIEPVPFPYTRKDLSEYNCEGCKGYCICGPCKIKPCAEEKSLGSCADCTDFPCEHILTFENDGMPHHNDAGANLRSIREIGEEAWFETIKPKLECRCGEKQTWYYSCSQHK